MIAASVVSLVGFLYGVFNQPIDYIKKDIDNVLEQRPYEYELEFKDKDNGGDENFGAGPIQEI